MMKKPEDILNEWIQAVNNRDIESLLALYNEQAVLMPTFSNRLLNNPNKIREYFEKLTSREELSVALHEKTLNVQAIKNDIYVLCGIYYWRFALDGELFRFEARFSYIIDITQSSPIIHHHSSQIPRML
jgi:hypothetical protein